MAEDGVIDAARTGANKVNLGCTMCIAAPRFGDGGIELAVDEPGTDLRWRKPAPDKGLTGPGGELRSTPMHSTSRQWRISA